MFAESYLTEEFWRLPPRENEGDAEADAIYRAVGWSLSQWAHVEIELGQLFNILVQSESQAASRAYGMILSGLARSAALSEAAEVFFSQHPIADYPAFKDMIKVVGLAAPRRNDIAHGLVVLQPRTRLAGGGHFLVPPTDTSRRAAPSASPEKLSGDPITWMRHRYALTARQIADYGEHFQVIEREATHLCHKLNRRQ